MYNLAFYFLLSLVVSISFSIMKNVAFSDDFVIRKYPLCWGSRNSAQKVLSLKVAIFHGSILWNSIARTWSF